MQQGRRALLGLALLGGVSHVLNTQAGTPAGQPIDRLDGELDAIAANPACLLASLSVLAIRNGRVVYEHQAGRQHIDGAGGPPVTRRTMFRIASISKMVTTLGVMRLVEEGKLALDNDVGIYLGFPLRNPHFPAREITLRMLLTHTASLRDAAGYSWPADRALKDILVPGARYYGTGEMWSAEAAPGEFFTYCNLNWGIIGTLMEKVTGERFDRLMKRLILAPLGLRGGYYPAEFSSGELADLATLYRKRTTDTEVWDANGPWIAQVDDYSKTPPAAPPEVAKYVPGTNATPFSPTGGLRISAADLGKLMLMLINRGSHEGKQILRPETLARMFTRQWTFDGHNGDSDQGLLYSWGMGNQQFFDQPGTGRQVVEGGGFAGVGHLGFAYGLRSDFMVDLEKGNGMVVLIGGTSSEPELVRGKVSSLTRVEEQILTALYRRAIAGI